MPRSRRLRTSSIDTMRSGVLRHSPSSSLRPTRNPSKSPRRRSPSCRQARRRARRNLRPHRRLQLLPQTMPMHARPLRVRSSASTADHQDKCDLSSSTSIHSVLPLLPTSRSHAYAYEDVLASCSPTAYPQLSTKPHNLPVSFLSFGLACSLPLPMHWHCQCQAA